MAVAEKTSAAGRSTGHPHTEPHVGRADDPVGLRARLHHYVIGVNLEPTEAARRALAEASTEELRTFCANAALMTARQIERAETRRLEDSTREAVAVGASISEAVRPLDKRRYPLVSGVAMPDGTINQLPLEDWTIEHHLLKAKWYDGQAKSLKASGDLHRKIAIWLKNDGVDTIREARRETRKIIGELIDEAAA